MHSKGDPGDMTIQEAARRSGLSAHTLERHREKVAARIVELTQDLSVLDYKIKVYREMA
ncbi:hypothetical protein Misp02_42240 [Microtetraspora sp. NBRC 16547]|nr:hypothetical protein Misp02_42240 [Microtetraspora sp. NBRC 16547]